MPGSRRYTGIKGEQIALSFLLDRGLRLVEKNFRCRSGEIDLILMDGDELVFVEVKARRGTGFGLPQEAVGTVKQAKIRRIAQYYLQIMGLEEQELRFDVVAIAFTANGAHQVEHLRGVF